MLEKERRILDVAIKLFSEKGYSLTSIQDIAAECGIAKGSIYSYFESKDEILIAALNYYFNKIMQLVNTLEKEQVNPRDKFITKLSVFLSSVMPRKKLIDLLSYDQELAANDNFKRVVLMKQFEIHQLYMEGLLSIYGQAIKPYIYDLAIMMEGMLRSYFRIFLIEQTNYDIRALVEYVVKRIDDVVDGLLKREDQPIISEIQMRNVMKKINKFTDSTVNQIKKLISTVKLELEEKPNNEDYLITIEVIEEELARQHPREQVISGMLSNLKGVIHVNKQVKEIKMLLSKL